MSAKDFLKGIRFLDVEIKSIQERVKILEADAEGLQAMRLSDMPRGGKARTSEDIIADALDLQSKYVSKIDELNEQKRIAERDIELIDHPEYRTVLRLRYLSCRSWEEVARFMGYSEQHIYRLHGQALKEFDKHYKDESK